MHIFNVAVSLFILSYASAITTDEENNKNGLRGNMTEEISSQDSHRLLAASYWRREVLTVYYGNWGGWKPWKNNEQSGMYACGAEIRFEDPIGRGDDTAANGLKLRYCHLNDWDNQQEETIWAGNWGSWKGMVMCPKGKYIEGGRVIYEHPVGGGDDTALNGLRIFCVDTGYVIFRTTKVVYPGVWGRWKGWVTKPGKLVKGARVRYEDPQGRGDDTAMNGIQFNVEYPHFTWN